MAIGTVAIGLGEPSEQLQARLQNLSAGLLTGAVITDIFPILRSRLYHEAHPGEAPKVNFANLVAGIIGFSVALLLMYSIKGMELEESGAEDEPPKAEALDKPLLMDDSVPPDMEERRHLRNAVDVLAKRAAHLAQLVSVQEVDREAIDEEVHGIDFLVDAARRRCRGVEKVEPYEATRLRQQVAVLQENVRDIRKLEANNLPAIDQQLKVLATALRNIHTHAEKGKFRRWSTTMRQSMESCAISESELPPPPISWGLVLAVVIDSMVDGMLIGLAASVDLKSGCLMAMATTIEMAFLGYSYSCTLAKCTPSCVKTLVLALPPLMILLASIVAGAAAHVVEHSPAFVGLIAFSLVALLFLVVEELLLEAHEKESSDEWHISGCLYVGLILSICLDVIV